MMFQSLQARLAITISAFVTALWLVAAGITANWLARDTYDMFDTSLQATAQRLLPLAARDARRGHENGGNFDVHIEGQHHHGDGLGRSVIYVVKDKTGQIILRSDGQASAALNADHPIGFSEDGQYRIYTETETDAGITITVAEPTADRLSMSTKLLLGLALPLLIIIPLSLLAIIYTVRRLFRPVRVLRQNLSAVTAQDLSSVAADDLPTELKPVVGAINQLLARLRAAFEAERSFAANAAHELRTPMAGAMAQAQRIQSETKDKQAAQRASDIEQTLKRLTRTSEKLMQFARAEGGRATLDRAQDVRAVLRIVVDDFARHGATRLQLSLPMEPVLSTIDSDALGILLRNLVENALRHGDANAAVDVRLTPDRVMTVINAGPALPEAVAQRIQKRFEKGDAGTQGTGLGLSIVRTIADRAGAGFKIISPLAGQKDGVCAQVILPI